MPVFLSLVVVSLMVTKVLAKNAQSASDKQILSYFIPYFEGISENCCTSCASMAVDMLLFFPKNNFYMLLN
jgi:hypothetical protein